jgi:hypothetical protein
MNFKTSTSYLCTYDLKGPVRIAFDADSIHYEGKWEGAGGWGLGPGNRDFFGPCEMASNRTDPPYPELIRNQQETVRCTKERSGT